MCIHSRLTCSQDVWPLLLRNLFDTIFKAACFDVLFGKCQVVRIYFMWIPWSQRTQRYWIKQVNTCEPSLCRYLYRILLIWCEIKTCQAADQINKPIIVMSAGFFLFLTVPLPKTSSCLNIISGGRKKIVKSLIVAEFYTTFVVRNCQ